jgi:stage IV sporulation protein B
VNPSYRRRLVSIVVLATCLIVLTGVMGYNVMKLPGSVRLAPGQEIRLSVGGPFHLYLPPSSPAGFIGERGKERISPEAGGICSSLLLKPIKEGISQIEVRLFGLPLRRLRVNVLRLPAVYAGGQAIGVLLSEEGVVVVGTIPMKDDSGESHYPAKDAGIQIGDLILSINEKPILHLEQLESMVQTEASTEEPLELTIRRSGTIHKIKLTPLKQKVAEEQDLYRYRMGIYVEDPAAGVGTLTFYTPELHFGALGHRIMGFGQREIPLNEGKVVQARITGVRPGVRGEPGEKIGIFASTDDIIGDIQQNTPYGIFGRLRVQPRNNYYSDLMQVALVGEVKPGPAEILTVLSGEKLERFNVEIQRVFSQSRPTDKGMIIRVVDPELLRRTGGIIQGMSGSPIIQNGKLIGAITHVFVNDPTQGYGVFAEWMLNAGGHFLKKAS